MIQLSVVSVSAHGLAPGTRRPQCLWNSASKRCAPVPAVSSVLGRHLLRLIMKILLSIKFNGETHVANGCDSPRLPIKELPLAPLWLCPREGWKQHFSSKWILRYAQSYLLPVICLLNPNSKWKCRDVIWGHFRASTASNKQITVISRPCSPEDARWSIFRVEVSDGWKCDAWFSPSPRVHLASLCGRNIVFSIADFMVCGSYWIWRPGRIACFLLHRGSARVCRRRDTVLFVCFN